MWVSAVRSTHNFYFAQEIRNRHAKLLAGPPPVHSMIYDPADPDNLAWSRIQRDEFDNANELLAPLKAGGLKSLDHAADQRDVDLYLLPGRR